MCPGEITDVISISCLFSDLKKQQQQNQTCLKTFSAE